MRLLSLFSLVGVCQVVLAQSLTIRAQLGPYPVSISHHEIRTNRSDPLAPTPESRRFMVTVYRPYLNTLACPAENQESIGYIPQPVAAGLLNNIGDAISVESWDSLQLINCTLPSNGTGSLDTPIVLFSHGLQGSRYSHASSLTAVASSGYTVVAIDHTYEAAAVVFPDGTVVPTNVPAECAQVNSTCAEYLIPIRVADAKSVLDAIQSGTLAGFSSYPKPLKIAMYGHSLGGATSAAAVNNDSRIITGMDVDGSFSGPTKNLTITKPFAMLGEETDVPTWKDSYQNNLKGWKGQANVNNTVHLSFTDGPVVVDALGLRKNLSAQAIAVISGTIDSTRNLEVGWRFTTAWLDYVFKGKDPAIWKHATSAFPDVRIAAEQ